MAGNDGLSNIVGDKLDKNNFHAWKFRITNFLKGKGYWDYIEGVNEEAPEIPLWNATPEQAKLLKDWHQRLAKVMYWMYVNVSDSIVGHIQDVDSKGGMG